MRRIIILFFLFPIGTIAQDFSASWEDLYSYFQVKDISYGDGKIYAAAQNAVFSYRRGTNATEKISSVNGISGENISAIHFSAAYNLLVIGYENGLINIYKPSDQSVVKVIDIAEKVTIAPPRKRINHFFEENNKLYISTNYGVSVFNLSRLEFGDTYFIGSGGGQLTVNQTTVRQHIIYAATAEEGMRYANINNPNLIDYNEWQTVGNENWVGVVSLEGNIYGVSQSNTLKRLNGNTFVPEIQFSQEVQDVRTNEGYLTVTMNDGVRIYDSEITINSTITGITSFPPQFNSALVFGNEIYVADNNQGLLKSQLNNPSYFDLLSPEGPLRNNVVDIDVTANELWVVYGEHTIVYDPYPLNSRGVSHMINDQWVNFQHKEFQPFRSIIGVTINPQRTNQAFFSSFVDGLMEILNDEVANVYRQQNSSLDRMTHTPSNPNNFNPNDVRVGKSVFDRSGNLWFTNGFSPNGLIQLPSGGGANDFVKYDITDVIPEAGENSKITGYGDLVIDNSGNLFFGSYDDGIIGYSIRTETFAKIDGGEGAGNLPNDYVTALALDNNNQLWVGTHRGLRVLFNPSGMFSNTDQSTNEIIILDNDGVAQELLAGISIASITVDGNNNKWIATDAGAFCVSPNGQETLYHFTTENSPLPTNAITNIQIDNSNGKVYIGTTKGLLAFQGNATSAANNLENVRTYPNPVRPQYEGMVTIDGLMENSNVKITDIEGNLVYEEFSEGGSIQWDTRAFGKYKVASGVYMVLITSEGAIETKVTKIMIIR